jgi:hypothetical protein
MAKTYKKVIANQEFLLKSDNEELLDIVVDDVDMNIGALLKKNPDDTPFTCSVLAALIATEKQILTGKQSDIDKDYISGELGRMAEFLTGIFQNDKIS